MKRNRNCENLETKVRGEMTMQQAEELAGK
jgi:hypothetical protein